MTNENGGGMVEKVARAIYEAANYYRGADLGRIDTADATRCARAAIAAMRQPTEAQLDAAEMDDGRGGDYDARQATEIWHAMIDAALTQEEGA